MKRPLHIALLEKLKNAGIGVTVNVSPFIVAHFKKPVDNSTTRYNKEMRPPILFFEDLLKRGFIQYDEEFSLSDYFKVIENPANNFVRWFSDIDIEVYLTSNGLDYLEKYHLEESIFSLNQASKRNYKTQIIFSIVTISLAALTVFLTYKNTDSSDIKILKMQRSIDTLKYEIKCIKMPLPLDKKSSKK